jgi:hypothetical protein
MHPTNRLSLLRRSAVDKKRSADEARAKSLSEAQQHPCTHLEQDPDGACLGCGTILPRDAVPIPEHVTLHPGDDHLSADQLEKLSRSCGC